MIIIYLIAMTGLGISCRGLVHSKWSFIFLGVFIMLCCLIFSIIVIHTDLIDYTFKF